MQRETDDQKVLTSELDVIRALFEGKWRYDVVRSLCDEPQRLSTLKRLVPKASKKMLIDTLHALEEFGWVIRVDKSAELKHVEYSLSDQWSDRLRAAVRKIGTAPAKHPPVDHEDLV